jgi:hypothetical protein
MRSYIFINGDKDAFEGFDFPPSEVSRVLLAEHRTRRDYFYLAVIYYFVRFG